jgi:glycine cleavage system transcriptional repressor
VADDNLVAVTVIGNDRPGIVASVTKVLYDVGCNLADVTSTILRGHFAMMLVVESPVGASDLEGRLSTVAGEMGLVVTARPVEVAETPVVDPTHMVSVYGADRPGIVFRVATELAACGANITDLTSRLIGSSESPVYALMLEVAAADIDLDSALSKIHDELGVEITIHPIDADLL